MIGMARIRKVLLLVLFCCLNASCTDVDCANVIIDVKSIVNKGPAEVETVLGKPDSVYTLQIMGRSILCHLYRDPDIEIQYPESVATDIVVYGPHDLPFDQTALSAFNLDYRKQHPSDYRKGAFIRWSDFDKFAAISFYNPRKDSLNRITHFDIFFRAKPSDQVLPL